MVATGRLAVTVTIAASHVFVRLVKMPPGWGDPTRRLIYKASGTHPQSPAGVAYDCDGELCLLLDRAQGLTSAGGSGCEVISREVQSAVRGVG